MSINGGGPSDVELGTLVGVGRQARVFPTPPGKSERFTLRGLGPQLTHVPRKGGTRFVPLPLSGQD